jgi:CheY-like chemotaxis protein/HPt (histidine-containing phosphotransfer) domain-containing protein
MPAADSLVGRRVLVVDDGPASRRTLHHWYHHWGMEEAPATDRQQALHALSKAAEANRPFDLAVIDAELPNGDAFEIAAEIAADPKHSGVRLILLTPLSYDDDSTGLHSVGFHAQLTKPLKLAPMLECLAKVISGVNLSPQVETPKPAESPAARSAPLPLKVLVAEDSPVNQKVILYQLQKLGYAADLVIDGEAVVHAVLSKTYDLVLLDCQMPKLDGYEATQKIRAAEQGRRTWIVAMTAHALTGDRERCLAVGMDDYIGKPVRLAELRNALTRYEASEARQGSAVNRSVLDDLREPGAGGDQMLHELISVYLRTSPKIVADLRQAADTRQVALIAQAAHLLRGSSINFGADRLCAICEDLEQKSGEDALDIVSSLAEDAEREFERVRQALEHELAVGAT